MYEYREDDLTPTDVYDYMNQNNSTDRYNEIEIEYDEGSPFRDIQNPHDVNNVETPMTDDQVEEMIELIIEDGEEE